MRTESFEFAHGTLALRGRLDSPSQGDPRGIVVLVPGDGRTNIAGGFEFRRLREAIVAAGYSSCVWDKPGCGRSDGRYTQRPVAESAQEVVDAIAELRQRGTPGHPRIGLWGESRGGWICPLVLQRLPGLSFWITVGGTDDQESLAYLLRRNLELEGRTAEEAACLAGDWARSARLFLTGGSVFRYLKLTAALRRDPFYQRHFGPTSSFLILLGYPFVQARYRRARHEFDEVTGLEIYVAGFRGVLESVDCPVLAVFGELDTMVDWRKTAALYQETLGRRSGPTYTLRVFPTGDHNLMESRTGAFTEKKTRFVEGYFELITEWLGSLEA